MKKEIKKPVEEKYIDHPMFSVNLNTLLCLTIVGFFIIIMPYDDNMHMFDSFLFGYDFSLFFIKSTYPFVVAFFFGHFIYYLRVRHLTKNKDIFSKKTILMVFLLCIVVSIIR